MTKEVTLRQAGGSVSATLPKDMADRLHLEPGDRVLAVESDRGILLTPYDPTAERALKTAKPGTVEFRKALRDEILATKELSGVHAVYNFKPGAYHGVDERSLVIVRLVNGAWTYAP